MVLCPPPQSLVGQYFDLEARVAGRDASFGPHAFSVRLVEQRPFKIAVIQCMKAGTELYAVNWVLCHGA
jgi:hypothetical protein